MPKTKTKQVDGFATLRARRFAPVHPLLVFSAINPHFLGSSKDSQRNPDPPGCSGVIVGKLELDLLLGIIRGID